MGNPYSPNESHPNKSRSQPSPNVEELASELDWAAISILRELHAAEAGRSTTELRNATGLGNKRVAHRRERLQELGLIDVDDAEEYPDHFPHPPKVHTLTERGEVAIQRGLIVDGPAPDPSDFKELAELLQSIHNDVRQQKPVLQEAKNTASQNRSTLYQAGGDFSSLGDRLEDVESRLSAIEERLEDHEERLSNKKDKGGYFS